ncbi:hypothetical protein V6N13_016814 [Hibiscus sabdariffa]
MSEGTPVGAHVIKMMGYIQTLEKLGFALNNELATDIILQSLSDSFKQFILNFNMNDIDKTLPQLLGMLRTAKSNLKKNGSNSIQIVRVAKERERKGQSLRLEVDISTSSRLLMISVCMGIFILCAIKPKTLKGSRNSRMKYRINKARVLRSDRVREYLSLDELLKECEIVSQLRPPDMPQWSGVSERRNRTLLDMVRSILSHNDLPNTF